MVAMASVGAIASITWFCSSMASTVAPVSEIADAMSFKLFRSAFRGSTTTYKFDIHIYPSPPCGHLMREAVGLQRSDELPHRHDTHHTSGTYGGSSILPYRLVGYLYVRSLPKALIQREMLLSNVFPGVAIGEAFPLLTHLLRKGSVVHQTVKCLCKVGSRFLGDEPAGFSVFDQVGNSGDSRSNHGFARREGFDQNQRESFPHA